MITQDVADLVGSKAGHAVLANTSYTFLLRQKPAVMRQVSTTFNLSQAEREYLVTANRGNGILILENEHEEIEVIASEKEHELITTNPDEIIKKTEKVEEPKGEEIKIDIDLTKNIHYAENMNLEERNFLTNQGYELRKGHGLKKDKPRAYFIRPMPPEGLAHTFLTELIHEEIKKHTNKVWRHQTEKPDILFINRKGQEVALEIETGIGFSKHKQRLMEKFENVKKQYPDTAYIVLTNLAIKCRYERFKLPIIARQQIGDFIKLNFK